jgi:hypothetical protein
MEDKKDIERIFQERLKDFEAVPPVDAWDTIEARLDRKKKTRVLPLWWQLAGVAAVLAIIITTVVMSNNEAAIPIEQIVVEDVDTTIDHDSTPVDASTVNDAVAIENIKGNSTDDRIDSNEPADPSSGTEAIVGSNFDEPATSKVSPDNEVAVNLSNTTGSENSKTNAIAQQSEKPRADGATAIATVNNDRKKAIVENEPSNINAGNLDAVNAVASNSDIDQQVKQDPVSTDPTNTQEKTLESIAAAAQDAADLDKDAPFDKKWTAATMVAPVISNTLGGSSINEQVANNSQDSDLNISYGVAVDYNFAPRWSVRTGVHQLNVNYSTQDVTYGSGAGALAINSAAPSGGFNNNAVGNSNTPPVVDDSFAQELVSVRTFGGFSGELSQQLGYLEVPLEVKYRLVDRRLGVNVLGGFSALFLTDNSVNVTSDGQRLDLGEDSNFQDFNQSANFGLGIDYRFTNRFGLSVEPTFKYQLNALRNDVADFRPYTLGVYTGLMYRF